MRSDDHREFFSGANRDKGVIYTVNAKTVQGDDEVIRDP
jgi:hypothetical protein